LPKTTQKEKAKWVDPLTPRDMDKILAAVRKYRFKRRPARHPERDQCLLSLMYCHGLRVSEARDMKISDVDVDQKQLKVNRKKNGIDGTYPLHRREWKLMEDWLRIRMTKAPGVDALFVSQKNAKLSYPMVWILVKRYAEAAGLQSCETDAKGRNRFKVHCHTLRHSAGNKTINRGVDMRQVQA
jgi:type 1 fimbriae regulatory protein FimB